MELNDGPEHPGCGRSKRPGSRRAPEDVRGARVCAPQDSRESATQSLAVFNDRLEEFVPGGDPDLTPHAPLHPRLDPPSHPPALALAKDARAAAGGVPDGAPDSGRHRPREAVLAGGGRQLLGIIQPPGQCAR